MESHLNQLLVVSVCPKFWESGGDLCESTLTDEDNHRWCRQLNLNLFELLALGSRQIHCSWIHWNQIHNAHSTLSAKSTNKFDYSRSDSSISTTS